MKKVDVYICGNTEILIDMEDVDGMDDEVALVMVEAAIEVLERGHMVINVEPDFNRWRGFYFPRATYRAGEICVIEEVSKEMEDLIDAAHTAMRDVLEKWSK